MRVKESAKPVRPLALLLSAFCALALGMPPVSADGRSLAQEQSDGGMNKTAGRGGIDRPPVVNVKPFEDIALKGKELIDEGKLDLKNSTLDVTATAERNDDGTLKPETVEVVGLPDNENLAPLVNQLVTAVSQSRLLGVLKGAKEVNMALKLDRQNVSILIAGELQSEEDAIRYATGYNSLINFVRRSKAGTEEGELYNGLKFGNDGKRFIMSFEMTKEAAGKMIADMLAKKAAKDAAATQNRH